MDWQGGVVDIGIGTPVCCRHYYYCVVSKGQEEVSMNIAGALLFRINDRAKRVKTMIGAPGGVDAAGFTVASAPVPWEPDTVPVRRDANTDA